MRIQLKVTSPDGDEARIVDLCDTEKDLQRMTVRQVKNKIREQLKITDDFRIGFRTEQLEDTSLLCTYGVVHLSTIYTVLLLPGGF